MRVIFHQPLDDRFAKICCLRSRDGDPHAVDDIGHARHTESTSFVVLIRVLNDRALSARADRAHRRMPAKIRKIQLLRQHRMKQILAFFNLVLQPVDVNRCHYKRLPW